MYVLKYKEKPVKDNTKCEVVFASWGRQGDNGAVRDLQKWWQYSVS